MRRKRNRKENPYPNSTQPKPHTKPAQLNPCAAHPFSPLPHGPFSTRSAHPAQQPPSRPNHSTTPARPAARARQPPRPSDPANAAAQRPTPARPMPRPAPPEQRAPGLTALAHLQVVFFLAPRLPAAGPASPSPSSLCRGPLDLQRPTGQPTSAFLLLETTPEPGITRSNGSIRFRHAEPVSPVILANLPSLIHAP